MVRIYYDVYLASPDLLELHTVYDQIMISR